MSIGEKLLIDRKDRFNECKAVIDQRPALQAHIDNVLKAGTQIGISFITSPNTLEGAGLQLRTLIPNNESSIMPFEADIEADMIDAAAAIRLELLKAGNPTLSVGDNSIPVDPAKVIELGLISVDENQVRQLVLARRALDSFVKGFPELLPYITVDTSGKIIVDNAVHAYIDAEYCVYATPEQEKAWNKITGLVADLEEIRDTFGITPDKIFGAIHHSPDGGYAVSPEVLLSVRSRTQKAV